MSWPLGERQVRERAGSGGQWGPDRSPPRASAAWGGSGPRGLRGWGLVLPTEGTERELSSTGVRVLWGTAWMPCPGRGGP